MDKEEGSITYELRFSDLLADAGWPVPPLLRSPVSWNGRWWALFGLLPGLHRSGPGDDRRRGRLLAEFHETTSTFPAVPRVGWRPVQEEVCDPELGGALRFVEQHFPQQGRILLWHREIAMARFAKVTDTAPTTVIHGDFNSRNLLFVGDQLSGVLDFESAHYDLRVADFALSWRARRDDVVLGYADAAPLSETDWYLLTPCLWAWAFLGVVTEVERMKQGEVEPHGFDWQVEMVLRRSPLMGQDAIEYRHSDD